MITPILKDPRPQGGTLYTFPSASRDLTRAFSNSEYEFAFSHFACLNLPDFRYGDFKDGDIKGIYLDNFIKQWNSNSNSNSLSNLAMDDLNKYLKWHMQSYVMNYEIAILNGFSLDGEKYDNEVLRNPSERIFFNWLQKVGGIKFNGGSETLSGYGDGVELGVDYDGTLPDESALESANMTLRYKIGNKLYTWKGGQWRSRVLVSKTVQYIGTIDMVNNVNIDYDSFNEIYLNIPSGVGGSEVVFKYGVNDSNYSYGRNINVENDEYCDNTKYIIGRNPVKLNMTDDVTLEAIYDSKYDINTGFESPIYKNDNGYCIDFDGVKYNGGSIESMNLKSEEDFEFNCVLIYYRIRRGSGNWCTNLYGVLFLEDITISDYNTADLNIDDERVGYIQRYPKFKNGNSWGLKLDLKIDAQPDSQMELRDKLYDDPNDGAGMQMFAEALMHLNDCTRIFYEVKEENTEIEERLYRLENIVSGVDTVYDLRDEVSELRTRVEMFQPTLDSLVGRMDDIENKVTSLDTKLGYLIREFDNFNKMNIEWDGIEHRLGEIDSSIGRINETNSSLGNKVTSLETDLGKIDSYIEDFLYLSSSDSNDGSDSDDE